MRIKNNLLRILNQRTIAYAPIYRYCTGSTTSAVLLSQLMYWFSMKDKIYKTDKELLRETLLTNNEFRGAKNKIKKLDFVTVTREGIPAKTYFEIDWDKYNYSLTEVANKIVEERTDETRKKKPDDDEIKHFDNLIDKVSEIHETSIVDSTILKNMGLDGGIEEEPQVRLVDSTNLPKIGGSDQFSGINDTEGMGVLNSSDNMSQTSLVDSTNLESLNPLNCYSEIHEPIIVKSLTENTTENTTQEYIQKYKIKSIFTVDILKEFESLPNINLDALFEWIEFKNYKKFLSIKKTMQMLNNYTKVQQQQMIDTSIMNDYQGLFPPQKVTPNANTNNKYSVANNQTSDPFALYLQYRNDGQDENVAMTRVISELNLKHPTTQTFKNAVSKVEKEIVWTNILKSKGYSDEQIQKELREGA